MNEKDLEKSFREDAQEGPGLQIPDNPEASVLTDKKAGIRRVTTMTQVELDRRELPERDWLICPLLQRRSVVMIYGARGTGKSYFVIAITVSLATGTDFMGWAVNEPHRVVFVDGEMPLETLQERFREAMAGCDGVCPENSYLKIIAADDQELGIPDLASREGRAAIEEHLNEGDVVVLDNLSTLVHSGQENDAVSWSPLKEWMLKLKRKGITVLLVHHSGKDGNQRGTSSREDTLDAVVALSNPEDYSPEEGVRLKVEFKKSRGAFGEVVKPFEASMHTEGGKTIWQALDLADANMDYVIELLKDGLPIRKIAMETGISKSTVGRLKKDAEAQGLV